MFFCLYAIKYGPDSLIQTIDGIQAKYVLLSCTAFVTQEPEL